MIRLFIQGTDITEAFECYHIADRANKVLSKYFIRSATEPRNYKLTFYDHGFYRTLKRKVAKSLETIGFNQTWKSKCYMDAVLISLFCTSIIATRTQDSFVSIFMTLAAGQFMAWLNTLSHNFIHQKDNWRMYAANIPLTGWRDWRIFHGMASNRSMDTVF